MKPSYFVKLGHGSGGRMSHQLLDDIIIPTLCGDLSKKKQNDSAVLELAEGNKRLAFSTDSYVVTPIFFPGGDIGDLAINGTVNDIAMSGARPIAISVGMIIEEGLPIDDLETILTSMKKAAEAANVKIVTGDTKVVPHGSADKIFINTAGIGVFDHDLDITGAGARQGDKVIVSGTLGDHGVAILASREGLSLETDICTDSAPLNGLVEQILGAGGAAVHVLRDPTRGGVGTTLKEIAQQSEVDIVLQEKALPIQDAVKGTCSILGLDPLFIANEGKLLAIVAPEAADKVLATMQQHPVGKDSVIIGEVTEGSKGRVLMTTSIGGQRIIDMLAGEQLPRIC